jgi:hypothetical protein
MYDALNRGFARAQGEVLAWLNSDEQYLPETLRKVADYFARHPEVEIIFGDIILVDPNGNPLSYRRVVKPNRVHIRLEHLCTPSCATFFRRSVIEGGPLFDTQWKSIGDAVWMHGVLNRGVRMACLTEPLSIYTFTGVNLSESPQGEREMRVWRSRRDAPAEFLRFPIMAWHRFRKLLAGAYRRRHLHYAIYTRASPRNRVQFTAAKVGFGWPGETAPPVAALRPVGWRI